MESKLFPFLRILAVAVLVCTVLVGCGGRASRSEKTPAPAPATTPANPAIQLPAAVQDRLDEIVAQYRADTKTPGLMAAVWTPDGRWATALGEAEISTSTPLNTDMQYRIASQTKPFVADLVLQLVGEGRVGLDDPIGKWVAGVPNGDAITILQLLNHTGGLGDVAFGTGVDLSQPETYRQVQAGCTLDDVLAPTPPDLEPGQRWDYSNYGYALLGRVAELAGEDSLANLIRTRITEPLGLARTYLPTTSGSGLAQPYAHGYAAAPDHPDAAPVDVTNLGEASCLWAYGGMVSTLDDLHTWSVALGTGRLLNADVWRQAEADMVPMDSSAVPGPSYGLGFMKHGDFIGHQGNWIGYDSATYYSPRLQTSISVVDTGVLAPGDHDSPTMLVERLAAALYPDADFGPNPGEAPR
jgi:D-alanyl-D-alanine carboxypeptidase